MSSPLPLSPLVGNMWVPVWALRPGSYDALKPVAAEMPLWLLLHTRNADNWRPCYASRDSLGVTLGASRAKVSRQLAALRKVGLVFEVDRHIEPKSRKHRPPGRWGLDPFTAELWRPEVEEALARIAEEDGHDGKWLARAVTALDAFDRRSRQLAARIGASMPLTPRRKKRKRGPRLKMSRRLKMSHEGMFLPPVRLVGADAADGADAGNGAVDRQETGEKSAARAESNESEEQTRDSA